MILRSIKKHSIATSVVTAALLIFCACDADSNRARPETVPTKRIQRTAPVVPKWPPHPTANLQVELEAGRLMRKALEGGVKLPSKPLLEGDVQGVYADQGRIGGFDYLEVVLGTMKHPDEQMPLVVLLHGRGARPFIPAGPYLTMRPLRLFIPRAPEAHQGGFSWLATWTNSGLENLLTQSIAQRTDQLVVAIEAFSQLHPTEGRPAVLGFSQGGILAFALAVRYPEFFRAAFPICGWLPPGLIPTQVRPQVTYPYIHAIHGALDVTVPTEKGRATVQTLRSLGLVVDYTEIPGVGHKVTEQMEELVRSFVLQTFDAEHLPAR